MVKWMKKVNGVTYLRMKVVGNSPIQPLQLAPCKTESQTVLQLTSDIISFMVMLNIATFLPSSSNLLCQVLDGGFEQSMSESTWSKNNHVTLALLLKTDKTVWSNQRISLQLQIMWGSERFESVSKQKSSDWSIYEETEDPTTVE